jgi:hypothetical protein
MSDRDTIVPLNAPAALIEEAKKERQRLLEQIEQSHALDVDSHGNLRVPRRAGKAADV